jgi:hypothetical protein
MKSMSIRNISDKVYTAIQEMARENRRSLQEQVKYLLEQEVQLRQGSSLSKALAWRDRLRNRRFNDSVESIREDRNR